MVPIGQRSQKGLVILDHNPLIRWLLGVFGRNRDSSHQSS